MRIWIDDIRTAPDGYVWKKSVNDTIDLIAYYLDIYMSEMTRKNPSEEVLESYMIEVIDLDHDSGLFEKDGGDYINVLNYIEQYKDVFCKMNTAFRIHSMNPVGRQNMERIIKKNGWKLIQ